MASAVFEGGKCTTKEACSGRIPHDFRERENHKNTDIDPSLSYLNRYYGCKTANEARIKYRKRVAECDAQHPPKLVRADRKTGLEIHIPAPRAGLPYDKLCEFYQKSYSALENFFSPANVIYGAQHEEEKHIFYDSQTGELKESRSGLHVMIIPMTDDVEFVPDKFKTGLNMHNFYRRSLPNMVNERLDAVCREVFGFDYRDGSRKKGKSVELLKEESAEIKRNMDTLASQQKQIRDNEDRLNSINEQIMDMQKMRKDIQAERAGLDRLRQELKAKEEALKEEERSLESEKNSYKETMRAENEVILRGMKNRNEARMQKELAVRRAKLSSDLDAFEKFQKKQAEEERRRHDAEVRERLSTIESDLELPVKNTTERSI